jgi:hypothetical protein
MATVIAHKLKQVGDPQHPKARASRNPGWQLAPPLLAPLRAGTSVFLLESQVVDGVTWWKAVDRSYAGCCLPFYWIASTVNGAPALEPLVPDCVDTSEPLSASQIANVDTREALTCFGDSDVQVEGPMRCGQAIADAGAFLLSAWESVPENPYVCSLSDYAYDIRGDILEPWTELGDGRETVVTGHFDDDRSGSCRWSPGNMGNFVPPEGGPPETAEFMCRLQFVVTQLALQ